MTDLYKAVSAYTCATLMREMPKPQDPDGLSLSEALTRRDFEGGSSGRSGVNNGIDSSYPRCEF